MSANHDMFFSGVGTLDAGDYDKVRIAGSGRLRGEIRCRSFHSAGTTGGKGSLLCREEFKASGSFALEGALSADQVKASGTFRCGGLKAKTAELSGSARIDGGASCGEWNASGVLKLAQGCEADCFRMKGGLDCAGLLNAETVEICFSPSSSRVQAIGGGSVLIEPMKDFDLVSLFSKLLGKTTRRESLTVAESIEADDVDLTNTVCPLVSGARVQIREGCRIDLVRYSESCEVSPEAEVGKLEKT